MSVIAGGTNALVQLLARRRVEQQQDMLRALQVADKQKSWTAEENRVRQADEQLKQTAENQKLLRLEADRRQDEIERLHEQQLAQNIRENALPEENMDPRAADLLKKYYLDNGIVQRTAGMSMDMQRTPQAPTAEGDIPLLPQANRGVLKVTPDKVSSLGGTRWQQARQADQEKKEAAKEAERVGDERLRDTLEARALAQRQHDQMLAMIKGMSAQDKPDYEEMAEMVRTNPAMLEGMTPTVKTKVMQHLGADFDYRKPMGEGATKNISEIGSSQRLVDRTITLLGKPEVRAEMGVIKGPLKAMVPGSKAQEVRGKLDLVRQVIGLQIEKGVLREADEAKYNRILLNISSDPDIALSQMKEVRKLLDDSEIAYRGEEDAQGRKGNPRVPTTVRVPPRAGAPAAPAASTDQRADDLIRQYGGRK